MPVEPSARRTSSSRTVIHALAYTCREATVSTWRQVSLTTVRLVIARCEVDYVGRLTAHLPMANRLLLVKADGSVSIHADDRAYKPLNWMSPPCTLREEPGRWTVTNRAGEQLLITLADVLHTPPTSWARTRAWSRTASRPTCSGCWPSRSTPWAR